MGWQHVIFMNFLLANVMHQWPELYFILFIGFYLIKTLCVLFFSTSLSKRKPLYIQTHLCLCKLQYFEYFTISFSIVYWTNVLFDFIQKDNWHYICVLHLCDWFVLNVWRLFSTTQVHPERNLKSSILQSIWISKAILKDLLFTKI